MDKVSTPLERVSSIQQVSRNYSLTECTHLLENINLSGPPQKPKCRAKKKKPKVATEEPKGGAKKKKPKVATEEPKGEPKKKKPEVATEEPKDGAKKKKPKVATEEPKGGAKKKKPKVATEEPKGEPKKKKPKVATEEPKDAAKKKKPKVATEEPKGGPKKKKPEVATEEPKDGAKKKKPKVATEEPKGGAKKKKPQVATEEPKGEPKKKKPKVATEEPKDGVKKKKPKIATEEPKGGPKKKEPKVVTVEPKGGAKKKKPKVATEEPKGGPKKKKPKVGSEEPKGGAKKKKPKLASEESINPFLQAIERALVQVPKPRLDLGFFSTSFKVMDKVSTPLERVSSIQHVSRIYSLTECTHLLENINLSGPPQKPKKKPKVATEESINPFLQAIESALLHVRRLDTSVLGLNSVANEKSINPFLQPIERALHVPKPRLVLPNTSVLGLNSDTNMKSVLNIVEYIDLDEHSVKFKEIKALFPPSLYVLEIKQVVNPFLRLSFQLKQHYQYSNVKPLELFHGTKFKHVHKICTFNFDWRLSGAERGHKYGKGVYFTPSAKFALNFCEENVDRVIILTDVLVNKKGMGTKHLHVPPEGCDTTVNVNKVFVKFCDAEFYPAYVIFFCKTKELIR